MMNVQGTIQDGQVVLPAPIDAPNGTVVTITVVETTSKNGERKPSMSLQEIKAMLMERRNKPPLPGPTIAETLAPFIGVVNDLPPNAGSKVDYHQQNGLAKKEETKFDESAQ